MLLDIKFCKFNLGCVQPVLVTDSTNLWPNACEVHMPNSINTVAVHCHFMECQHAFYGCTSEC